MVDFATERPGRVRVVDKDGKLLEGAAVSLDKVKEIGEGGLLGIALDPKFSTNNTVYVYYTYSAGSNSLNRVAKLTYDADTHTLGQESTLVDAIPGNSNHNGGRIKFGADGFLYVGTGDAEDPSQAQDTNAKGGKVLRVTTDGQPAPGNPFNNFTYSYGHRNVQGLAWNAVGELWETEHGPSGLDTGYDEINMIEPGKNYGWSVIKGDATKEGMESPKKQSGKGTAWAPSGAAFVGNSLYFSGLRGQALYEALQVGESDRLKEHLKGTYGRIREVVAGQMGCCASRQATRIIEAHPGRG
jgi:glucose/arabinose dehydrogenase